MLCDVILQDGLREGVGVSIPLRGIVVCDYNGENFSRKGDVVSIPLRGIVVCDVTGVYTPRDLEQTMGLWQRNAEKQNIERPVLKYVEFPGIAGINNFSHSHADRILKDEADIIKQSYAKNGVEHVEIFHMGGGKFAVLSQNLSDVEHGKIEQNIAEQLQEKINGRTLREYFKDFPLTDKQIAGANKKYDPPLTTPLSQDTRIGDIPHPKRPNTEFGIGNVISSGVIKDEPDKFLDDLIEIHERKVIEWRKQLESNPQTTSQGVNEHEPQRNNRTPETRTPRVPRESPNPNPDLGTVGGGSPNQGGEGQGRRREEGGRAPSQPTMNPKSRSTIPRKGMETIYSQRRTTKI